MERGEPMDEPKRVDPRTRKTKRAIRNAVAKLLSEYDLNDITVREIAELAEINRKTFYRYYSGIYQVLDEIENEIVSSFDQILGHIDFKKDLENPYRIFERLTATINTDIEFYGYLLSMRGNVNLVSKIAALLKAKAKEALMVAGGLFLLKKGNVAYSRWIGKLAQATVVSGFLLAFFNEQLRSLGAANLHVVILWIGVGLTLCALGYYAAGMVQALRKKG